MAARGIIPRLTLYSKSGNCSLCDAAKEVLQRVQAEIPHELEIVDITDPGNKKWFDLYRYEIPVLHYKGQEIMRHFIDVDRLRQALQNRQ